MGGRPKRTSHEEFLGVLGNFKKEIVVGPGKFASKSAKVWHEISSKLHDVRSPLAIYTAVLKNYYNTWEFLGISTPQPRENSIEESVSEEDDDSTDDTSPLPKIKFTLSIPQSDYRKMDPEWVQCKRSDRRLGSRRYLRFKSGVWTHVIMAHFFEATQLPCNLIFKNARLHPSSNAQTYAHIVARCGDCQSAFDGYIACEPDASSDVEVTCTYSGAFNSAHYKGLKRPLSGALRKEVSDLIINTHSSASVFIREQAQKSMTFGDPVPSTLPSANAVRVAVHENLKKTRLAHDPVQSLVAAMDLVPFQGVIRDVGIRRFYVHYWSSAQLTVFRAYCQKNPKASQISIDATGSVARKITYAPDVTSAALLLYEITVNDPLAAQQYSVGNMLSARQDTNSITYWLMEWKRSGAPVPKVVVTDMSAALMSAVIMAFTEFKTTAAYLEHCATVLLNQSAKDFKVPDCFVRNDIAHTVKLMTTWKSLKGVISRTRKFYLRAMAQVLQSTDIEDVKALLKAIFTVAFSETEGNDCISGVPNRCSRMKKLLQMRIGTGIPMDRTEEYLQSSSLENIDDPDDPDDPDESDFCVDFSASNISAIPERSFQLWVNALAADCKMQSQLDDNGDTGNQQYLKDIVPDICHLVRLLPFCSAVMIPLFGYGNVTASSAPVESSFNDVKNRIFSKYKLPIRVDEFVFKHIEVLDGTMKLAAAKAVNRHESIAEESLDDQSIYDDHLEERSKEERVAALNISKETKRKAAEQVLQEDVLDENMMDESLCGDTINDPTRAPSSSLSGGATCPACAMGDIPGGAHKCAYCRVAVHVLPGCSIQLEGQEEGYGEKRVCFSCADKNTLQRSAMAEPHEFENWMNLGKPSKARKRKSYLEPNSEWVAADLSSHRPVVPISLLKNGNKLKALRKQGSRVLLTNTCAFDSLLQLCAASYCDSAFMKSAIERESTSFHKLVTTFVLNGVNLNVYHLRYAILSGFIPFEALPSNVIRYDCMIAIVQLVKQLFPASPSLVENSTCSSECCPEKERHISHQVATVHCSAANIGEMDEILSSVCDSPVYTECHAQLPNELQVPDDAFAVTEDTGVRQCTGVRCRTSKLSSSHLFCEIVDNSAIHAPEITIKTLKTELKVSDKKYYLRGVVGFTGVALEGSDGHYVAYCRRHDDHWEAYDDLQDEKLPIHNSKLVKVAMVYYSV